ncbi:MAG: glycosyltransferase family 4 protein, partial [Rhodospirillales bacterium]|nr:glycosyltransferase family 4 protein [Rhodospirillales bacterium]
MRITLLNQFYRPDIAPTAHLAASLAEDRARRGDQVTVVASRGGYVEPAQRDAESSAAANPKIYRVWTPMLGKKSVLRRCLDYLSYYIFTFIRMLMLPRQDVIISLTTPPFIVWAALVHRMLHRRTRVILWNMDCYPEAAEQAGKLKRDGFLSRIMRFSNRAIFRRISHLVVLDTAMRDLLMSQYAVGQNQPPVTIIPNWEDASFFPADAKHERWEGIDRLKLDGRLVVLYLGNMGVGHDFDAVIEAAKQLRDESMTLLFVGGGGRTATLEQAAKEHQLDNLIVHPYVPKENTGQVMAAVDCALITLQPWALGIMSPSKLHANLALSLPIVYVGPET